MSMTNKHNLPPEAVRFLERDDYSIEGADISVSQLIMPAQMLHIINTRKDELPEEDVADNEARAFGTAMHIGLSLAQDPEHTISEKRLFMDVDTDAEGWTVSGKPDTYVFEDKAISDFKSTSAWSIVYGSRELEWEQTQNIYRLLLEANGYEVEKLRIVAFLKDWKARDYETDKGKEPKHGQFPYPDHSPWVIELPLWSKDKAQKFLERRVKEHQAARQGEQIDCTDEERWKGPKGYTRCRDWCRAAPLCPQYQGGKK